MRRSVRSLLAAALLTACSSLAGCLEFERLPYQIDPGETGYSHAVGCVAQRFVYPAPLVEKALLEAMTDMQMHSVRRATRALKPKDGCAPGEMICLTGMLYTGRLIVAEVEPQGEATGVRIRIDAYGDEPVSNVLLQRTGIRLATLPQAVNPPFDTRALSDSANHRGMEIEGYRGAPLR